MTLWRLELLRLWRTHRWLAIAGTFGFFALLGPLAARYLQEIVSAVGGDVEVQLPAPTAVEGMAQFVSNLSQLGVLAVVVVAAAAFVFDRRIEASVFYRSRLESVRRTVTTRWVVTAVAVLVALVVATAIAWGLTTALIEAPELGATALGTLYGALYFGFVVSVTLAVASFTRTVITTTFATVAVLLLFPVLSLIGPLEPWLPSELLAAVVELVAGAPASDFARATLVTVVTIPLLVSWAITRLDRREL